MWNIEIGESVPGTWEPLPWFMANAEVETSWQPSIRRNSKSPNGERASFKIAWAPEILNLYLATLKQPGSTETRLQLDRKD